MGGDARRLASLLFSKLVERKLFRVSSVKDGDSISMLGKKLCG